MTALTVADLSTATIEGTGAFDVLMRATKAHLEDEFKKGRIKGPEYSTVYLGSLDRVMQTGLAFLLSSRKESLEADLLAKQIELAGVEVQKAMVELAILEASQNKIPAEIALLQAQAGLVGQQKTNLIAEALNIPKQGLVLDAQQSHVLQQTTNLVSEELGIDARTSLTNQQKDNAEKEELVLVAQECKLRAEFDLTQATKLKTDQEIDLLAQKTQTERAQTTTLGVDLDSVIGRQKQLYVAQTDGFKRDAEQKAAKLLADTWSVRRTTDEGTVADATNMLNDATVGRAINKLLTGVGA